MTTQQEASRSPIATLTPLFADRVSRAVLRGAPAPHTSCLVATTPRSGSWLLAELLWNTAQVGEPHEYFRPDFIEHWAAEWNLPARPEISRYIDAAARQTQTDNGVFAAKVHWYQFAWLTRTIAAEAGVADSSAVDLAAWVPNPRYILLRRRDKARQAISYYIAANTGIWYATGTGGDEPTAAEFDLQQIRWFEDVLVDQEARWRRYFRAHDIVPLEICYEDLAADPTGTVRDVLEFLGICPLDGPTVITPRLKVQSDASTDRVLQSYLTVRDELTPRPDDLTWRDNIRRFVRSETRS